MTDHSRFRATDRADVYKNGRRAATLTRSDSGEVSFAYLEDFAGAPVASTLPVSAEPVQRPGGGVPAFFAGLLPEGHRLTVLRDEVKTSYDDELSLLLAIGTDTPGDVQVVAAGEPIDPVPPMVDFDSDPLDFRALTGLADRHGLPGVQAKASASMITQPVGTIQGPATLKIDPPEHPHLVANEVLHLEAARSLRMEVSAARIVRDAYGLPGLLARRFDRVPGKGRHWDRLAMEDGAQALDVLPARKYAVDTSDVISGLAEICSAPLIASRQLFIQFAYAWLTGNGDLHAKNVAVLQGQDERWRIAPVFDVPCTLLYGDDRMALPVAGRTSRIRARHWEELTEEIGLPPGAARSALKEALSAASSVNLGELPSIGSPLTHAERELRHRRAELADRL
ncbi:type II toxin-antitoxin system HipA family toxin [Corynebacterium doosanense]|uniref:HipA-like protein n=1 Tax=Corynebacterium doosanense CAU 212 = DSM 45436 TaxID=558173 RepID=A0A097IEZ0_9CORY|nr:HipA domain-containing protein [Corynebacterium doosanense]AIT60690.1 HipA-like protein [Corynebacterium doosanense CAU 212 = DSM 45436]